MKKKDLSKTLESIESIIEKIESKKLKEAVSVLYNLVEDLDSEISRLREDNQTLKDENNRLKGEQGKPDFKPNKKKDGDISSEQERKEAEASVDQSSREGFKVDKSSLEKLKENRIPALVLEQLENLVGQKYSSKTEFVEAVKSLLGSDVANRYINLLVKYAHYKKRNRKAKVAEIHIDRVVLCPVDITKLPKDAVSKGYKDKVVQDLIIKTDNIKFKREVFYSPSMNKIWLGEVPVGYEGDYGPHLNSNIVSMKYASNMTIPKINTFLNDFGMIISGSYISNRLTKHLDLFHQEKSEIYLASLESSSYQQIDDTGCRVNGENHYTQIVCNPYVTVFFTTKKKSRLTIIDVLRNFESRSFLFNEETFSLLEQLKVPKKCITQLDNVKKNIPFNEQQMNEILDDLFPDPNKGKTHRIRIMEASAIAYYHQQTEFPIVKSLVADDAPQFKLIASILALCWPHDGRHYKRLSPIVPNHQKALEKFLGIYWGFYGKLHSYKKNPSSELANSLSDEFDNLFSTKTCYDELNRRIEKSKAKKKELLAVLKHPELPLHNNLSENGARVQKRREDASLHTITDEGTKAKDTMMTIGETCRKLGVSTYLYIHDRISKTFKMPSLAKLIREKADCQSKSYDTS